MTRCLSWGKETPDSTGTSPFTVNLFVFHTLLPGVYPLWGARGPDLGFSLAYEVPTPVLSPPLLVPRTGSTGLTLVSRDDEGLPSRWHLGSYRSSRDQMRQQDLINTETESFHRVKPVI